MSEENVQPNNDQDDLEMFEAIRAAFGDEATENINAGGEATDSDKSFEDMVREIDNAAQEGAQAVQAKRPTKTAEVEETTKFLLLEMGDSLYGIPMENVYEIQRVPTVTFLPNVPEWVLGVTNLRGNIVSVVSLQLLLGQSASEQSSNRRRLVVTQSLVDDLDSGLVVDRVAGIRLIRKSDIKNPTSTVDPNIMPFLMGVLDSDEQIIALLDIEKLLLSEEFRQFDAA